MVVVVEGLHTHHRRAIVARRATVRTAAADLNAIPDKVRTARPRTADLDRVRIPVEVDTRRAERHRARVALLAHHVTRAVATEVARRCGTKPSDVQHNAILQLKVCAVTLKNMIAFALAGLLVCALRH